MSTQPEFSVIVTCYYESKSIIEFHQRLTRTLQSTNRTYEIIMINDGSTDDTYEKLLRIYKKDSNTQCVMTFFRNFGQAAASTAGIAHARGKHFIFIDSDLQLDPEELPKLIAEFDNGCDLVTGFRKSRRDPIFRLVVSKLSRAILQHASRSKVRDFGCTFKIFNGSLLRAFECSPFRKVHFPEVMSYCGKIVEVPVTHHTRRHGKSGWRLGSLMNFFLENLVNISDRPFQYSILLGLGVGFVLLLRVLLGFLVPFSVLPSVSNGLILNVLTIVALVLVALLSIVGELVIRSFRQLQRKPIYIIKDLRRKELTFEPGLGTEGA